MFGSMLRNIPQQIRQAVQQQPQQQAPMPMQGGMGAGFGGMPAPMQNPFMGGQGVSAAQMNPQQYQAAPVPNADAFRREMGTPNDPGLTPYKLGQTLGGQPQFIPDAPLPEGMVGITGGNGFDPVTGRVDLGTAGGSGYYVPQGQRQQPTSRLLQSVQQQQLQQQRPVSPFLQRVAQSMQRQQQQTQQPAQGIGTGIASLLGRFGGF